MIRQLFIFAASRPDQGFYLSPEDLHSVRTLRKSGACHRHEPKLERASSTQCVGRVFLGYRSTSANLVILRNVRKAKVQSKSSAQYVFAQVGINTSGSQARSGLSRYGT